MTTAFKIVLVGDRLNTYSNTATDKTVLLHAFTTNGIREDEYIPTVFDNYSAVHTIDGTNVNMGLWDTSGTEQYERNRALNYPQTDVFILVFSVVNPASLHSIYNTWWPETHHHCPYAEYILVGYAIEKRDDRAVLENLSQKGQSPITYKQGATVAKLIGAQKYLEVDMKQQHTVKQAFEDAVRIRLAFPSQQFAKKEKGGFFGTKKKNQFTFSWTPNVQIDVNDMKDTEEALKQKQLGELPTKPTEIVVPNYAATVANANKEVAAKSNPPLSTPPTLSTPPIQPASSKPTSSVPSSTTPKSAPPTSTTSTAQKPSTPSTSSNKDLNKLPSGWQEATDDNGCVYYYNSTSNETTWLHPATGRMHDTSTLFFNNQSKNNNNNATQGTTSEQKEGKGSIQQQQQQQQGSPLLTSKKGKEGCSKDKGPEKQSPIVETKQPQQNDTGTQPMTLMLQHEDSNYAIDFDGTSVDSLKSLISSEIELRHTNFIVECWNKKLNQFVKMTKITQLEDTLSIRIKISNNVPTGGPSTTAPYQLVPIPKNDPEFQDVRDKIAVDYQQHHEFYVVKRIEKKQLPITFKLVGLSKVLNGNLETAFQVCHARLQSLNRTEEELKIRRAYHGTRGSNIESICRNGLLKVGNTNNPSKATDVGWFGDPKKGVYLSRYVEYTLQYSNAMAPLDIGERAKIVMFKSLPGRTFHVPAISQGMAPKQGYDSHSSPNWLEWYLFDEGQCCPIYVVELEAIENTRINANDGVINH